MPRRLTLFAVFALLAACGQKAAQVPLAPLFGTAADDAAVAVTLQKRLGHVYVAGNSGSRAFVRGYTRAGVFRWERLVTPPTGRSARTVAADVDAAGNVYLATVYTSSNPDVYPEIDPVIAKYSRGGGLLWRKPFANLLGMDVDTLGNLYLVGDNSVRKHDPQGGLLWERSPSNRNAPMVAVAVSARGNVVAASGNGLIVKYAGDGTQRFRTVRNFGTRGVVALALGPNEEIAATSSDGIEEGTVTTRTLAVFGPGGARVWDVTVYDAPTGGFETGVAFGRDGSVYLTTGGWACGSGVRLPDEPFDGAVCDRGSDRDPERSAVLVNKYTLTGAPVWARVLNKDRPGLDAGTGVAAFSADELYLIGDTVNGFGTRAGGVDAFLLRLDAQGGLVWAR